MEKKIIQQIFYADERVAFEHFSQFFFLLRFSIFASKINHLIHVDADL
jgi:hypothetical protein